MAWALSIIVACRPFAGRVGSSSASPGLANGLTWRGIRRIIYQPLWHTSGKPLSAR